jgi:hypothetical protein
MTVRAASRLELLLQLFLKKRILLNLIGANMGVKEERTQFPKKASRL